MQSLTTERAVVVPVSPRSEETMTFTDQVPLEMNTVTSPPTSVQTDTLPDSDTPSHGGDTTSACNPTFDQPVLSKTSSSFSAVVQNGKDGNRSGVPIYAQPAVITSSTIPNPPVADIVVYDDVKGYQNSQVCKHVRHGVV